MSMKNGGSDMKDVIKDIRNMQNIQKDKILRGVEGCSSVLMGLTHKKWCK